MQSIKIPHVETGYFSTKIQDFLNRNEKLSPFLNDYFSIEGVKEIINKREQFPFVDRAVLSETLLSQYEGLDISEATKANIAALANPKTYTITTAHQLNLFTGPLYFFYKILHCINLCEQLNDAEKDHRFVPIFWMHTEDHDFEEVNHLNIFDNKIEWKTEQTGAVGNFKTTGLAEAIGAVSETLGQSENAQAIVAKLKEHFLGKTSYKEGMFSFINWLFKDYGLVIVDQQNGVLKTLISDYFHNELTQHDLYNQLLLSRKKLEAADYEEQALPRAINLFYIEDSNQRNRIVFTDDHYQVLNTNLRFTEEEILQEFKNNPNRFSTNVLSRPVFQQSVLPNLAYIGGGGELAYWMQLKASFNKLNVFYPPLILRQSLLIVSQKQEKKLAKIGFTPTDLFTDFHQLVKQMVREESDNQLNLTKEKEQLSALFDVVVDKAKNIDPTLERSAEGEKTKQLNSLEKLETKILRAEKRKYEDKSNQLERIQQQLFPNNSLQERKENFLSFWLTMGNSFVPMLKENINPTATDFVVLIEE